MMQYYRIVLVSILSLILLSSCFVGSTLVFTESDTHGKHNLLANPGFTGSAIAANSLPTGWTLMNVDRAIPETISLDYTQNYEGDSSLRIDASKSAVMIVSDAFHVRRYGGYYLRIKVKSSKPIGEHINMQFITFNNNGRTLNRFKKKVRSTEEWKTLSLSAGFIREGANFGRLAILIPPFDEGSLWIDDAGAWEVHSFKID